MNCNCNIVRDLFTGYISGSASEDSRALVEEHIRTCGVCAGRLAELQGRMTAELQKSDAVHTSVLKNMKKRVARKNILIAAAASIAAIALAITGFWFVFNNDKPIPYEEGMVRAEISTAESNIVIDGATGPTTVLDIVSLKKYYCNYATSRVLNVNGVDSEVVYFYLSETLFTKWFSKSDQERVLRLVGVNENMSFGTETVNHPSLPMEVYYLPRVLSEADLLAKDDGFYALRKNGVLLWSGSLKGENSIIISPQG